MIYKIPIYVEVEVEGDFQPAKLTDAINTYVYRKISETVIEYGGFPHTESDFVDDVALNVAKATGVRRVKISLLPKSKLLQKIADRE
jgi:dihydroneopterin aldolase